MSVEYNATTSTDLAQTILTSVMHSANSSPAPSVASNMSRRSNKRPWTSLFPLASSFSKVKVLWNTFLSPVYWSYCTEQKGMFRLKGRCLMFPFSHALDYTKFTTVLHKKCFYLRSCWFFHQGLYQSPKFTYKFSAWWSYCFAN